MIDITNKINKSLLKREDAINRFNARREAFWVAKSQITSEFEEARKIWIETLAQFPIQEFKDKKGTPPRKSASGNRKSSIVSTYQQPINLSTQK